MCVAMRYVLSKLNLLVGSDERTVRKAKLLRSCGGIVQLAKGAVQRPRRFGEASVGDQMLVLKNGRQMKCRYQREAGSVGTCDTVQEVGGKKRSFGGN